MNLNQKSIQPTQWCGALSDLGLPGFHYRTKSFSSPVALTQFDGIPVPPEAGEGLLTPEQRADFIRAANGVESGKTPERIPFGPHFTCSQCGTKIHDDIIQDGAGKVWCSTCVEKQLKAQAAPEPVEPYRVGSRHPSPSGSF